MKIPDYFRYQPMEDITLQNIRGVTTRFGEHATVLLGVLVFSGLL